jgi:hypothetical protein
MHPREASARVFVEFASAMSQASMVLVRAVSRRGDRSIVRRESGAHAASVPYALRPAT